MSSSSLNEVTVTESIDAGLVLATGSNRGRVALMEIGYYAIGRDGECQIRPKSRSVSRFHCLISRTATGMRIMDLDSTSGTLVAGRRIDAKRWFDVQHGDEIRCGKIAFEARVPNVTISVDREADAFESIAADSMDLASDNRLLTGAALCEDDIADFLVMADEDDRQRRYQQIIGAETIADRDAATASEAGPQSSSDERAAVDHDRSADETRVSEKGVGTGRSAKFDAPVAPAKKRKKPKRAKSSPNFSMQLPGGSGRSIAVAALCLVALTVLGMQIVRNFGSPDVRIVRGIDR